jgi:hypothetical protein
MAERLTPKQVKEKGIKQMPGPRPTKSLICVECKKKYIGKKVGCMCPACAKKRFSKQVSARQKFYKNQDKMIDKKTIKALRERELARIKMKELITYDVESWVNEKLRGFGL